MDDTLALDEDEEIEEEADAEVDKVLYDLTNGKLGLAGPAPAPPVSRHAFYSCIGMLIGFIANCGRETGRRRDREGYGTISTATQWFAQRIIVFCAVCLVSLRFYLRAYVNLVPTLLYNHILLTT